MSPDFVSNLLVGTSSDAFTASGLDVSLDIAASSSNDAIVGNLRDSMDGAITALYPTIIAVVVLFAGYYVLKRLYHSRF